MASFGTFLAACGFDYHGPGQRLAFDPRITPDNFRAPFVTAEGWGTYSQKLTPTGQQTHEVVVKYGRLRLRTLDLKAPKRPAARVEARLDGHVLPATVETSGASHRVIFADGFEIPAGSSLTIDLA
jgi:hypothetical protein